ncbi:15195_t:CDS:2 [Gigaspora rosea]|nr:15195_t:CDS:2 [Gigaspora rosea]
MADKEKVKNKPDNEKKVNNKPDNEQVKNKPDNEQVKNKPDNEKVKDKPNNEESEELIKIREKKFILMHLKEEWETAEKNLARRKTLMLGHVSAASITIIIGICLLLISKFDVVTKILTIVTSSITASGGILTLIMAMIHKASANKDKITKFIHVIQSYEKVENMNIINMNDKELKWLKTERHENYIKFLASVTILVSISSIVIPLPNLIQCLAIGIITCGMLWLINIILSNSISFFETVSNWDWKSADDQDDHDNKRMGFQGPISIFYILMRRIYVIDVDAYETYFGKYRTENGNVTIFGAEMDAKLILRVVLMLNKLTYYPIKKIQELAGKFKNILEKIINDLAKKIEEFEVIEPKKKEFTAITKEDRNFSLIEKVEGNTITFCKYHTDKTEMFEITIPCKPDKIIKINKLEPDEDKNNLGTTPDNWSVIINMEDSEKVINIEDGNNEKDDNNEKETKDYVININRKVIEFFKFAMIIAKDVKDNKHRPEAVDAELDRMGIVDKGGIDIFKTFKTTNDDEVMMLAIKTIKKNYNFKEYLTKHDKNSFSFRKIYRLDIKEHFWKLFKKVVFNIPSDLVFKIEDIKLTKKHKHDIRRLLCGLENQKHLIMDSDKEVQQQSQEGLE